MLHKTLFKMTVSLLALAGIAVATPAAADDSSSLGMYSIDVRTGNDGTDSNIYIKLYGDYGTSEELRLQDWKAAGKCCFEKNTNSKFFIQRSPDLGKIYKIRLRSDGRYAKSDWVVNEVKITHNGFHFGGPKGTVSYQTSTVFDYGAQLITGDESDFGPLTRIHDDFLIEERDRPVDERISIQHILIRDRRLTSSEQPPETIEEIDTDSQLIERVLNESETDGSTNSQRVAIAASGETGSTSNSGVVRGQETQDSNGAVTVTNKVLDTPAKAKSTGGTVSGEFSAEFEQHLQEVLARNATERRTKGRTFSHSLQLNNAPKSLTFYLIDATYLFGSTVIDDGMEVANVRSFRGVETADRTQEVQFSLVKDPTTDKLVCESPATERDWTKIHAALQTGAAGDKSMTAAVDDYDAWIRENKCFRT